MLTKIIVRHKGVESVWVNPNVSPPSPWKYNERKQYWIDRYYAGTAGVRVIAAALGMSSANTRMMLHRNKPKRRKYEKP